MSTKEIQKEEPLGKVISTRYFFFGYLILLSCLDCKFHLFNSVEKSCLSYEVSGKNGTTLTCRSFSVYPFFLFCFFYHLRLLSVHVLDIVLKCTLKNVG